MALPEFVITLIGNDTVGKTSIVNRLRYGTYQPHYIYTQGADEVRIPKFKVGNDTVSLLIFDTGGHHIQRGIIHKFIDAADAVIIVYDISKEKSFRKIPEWIQMTKKRKLQDVNENSAIGSSPDDDDPLLMIIGNKTDLSATDVRWSSETTDNDEPKEIRRSVKENQLRKTAAANNISMYKEVSAKADINIDLTFKSVVEKLIELRGTSKALNGNMKESKPWHKFCDIL
ncbi:uncharacterized protein LOC134719463 [Mytilus trossulus]|uniref:uncharacterized protein LOC134719463 n=1 Tax=Mytilus trossulus TaxID=6551 RepID=UPI003004411D